MTTSSDFVLTEKFYFVIVNVVTILVNKYVLSVLKFTIPTVFQGWQTLVCVMILSILAHWKKLSGEIETFERRSMVALLFPLLCFTITIVAGSKALAELAVPVFLAGVNVIPATLIILNSSKSPSGSLKVTASFMVYGSVAILFVLTVNSSSQYGWFWLGVHITSAVLHNIALTAPYMPRFNAISLIYYRNFFSIIILIPLSIYLEEAAHAFHYHNRLANINFYVGCILSGILGTWLQFLNGRIEDSFYMPFYLGMSKILTTIASWYLLVFDLELLAWVLIFLNQIASAVGFTFDWQYLANDIPDKTVVTV